MGSFFYNMQRLDSRGKISLWLRIFRILWWYFNSTTIRFRSKESFRSKVSWWSRRIKSITKDKCNGIFSNYTSFYYLTLILNSRSLVSTDNQFISSPQSSRGVSERLNISFARCIKFVASIEKFAYISASILFNSKMTPWMVTAKIINFKYLVI